MKKNKTIIIGISGDKGSFSEEAAQHYCQEKGIEDYKLEYLIDMEGVLKALNKKKIKLGIFPIVNSAGGVVEQAIKAMGKHNFRLIDNFKILIKHCLLARDKKSKIRKIVSHPQALKQCEKNIKKYWPKAEIREYIDTAKAAKDLARGKLGNDSAAITPEACAGLYNLKIVKKGIQDKKDNYTTFLAVK